MPIFGLRIEYPSKNPLYKIGVKGNIDVVCTTGSFSSYLDRNHSKFHKGSIKEDVHILSLILNENLLSISYKLNITEERIEFTYILVTLTIFEHALMSYGAYVFQNLDTNVKINEPGCLYKNKTLEFSELAGPAKKCKLKLNLKEFKFSHISVENITCKIFETQSRSTITQTMSNKYEHGDMSSFQDAPSFKDEGRNIKSTSFIETNRIPIYTATRAFEKKNSDKSVAFINFPEIFTLFMILFIVMLVTLVAIRFNESCRERKMTSVPICYGCSFETK